MDYNTIREMLKGLISENTTDTDVEKITNIVSEIDKAEQESNDLLQKNEALREKYINAVRNSAFGGNPKENLDSTPKTFEDCVQEVIDNRK